MWLTVDLLAKSMVLFAGGDNIPTHILHVGVRIVPGIRASVARDPDLRVDVADVAIVIVVGVEGYSCS